MDACMLCPRRCGVTRGEKTGYCGSPEQPSVARAALHMWEEPCISGSRGSGAVFFTGCNLGCVYCQNRGISRGGQGRQVSSERLREIYFELIAQGAHNINLVTATHYTAQVAKTLGNLPVPVVWNSGGYELPQTLSLLDGKVNIYMPDMKYSQANFAAAYSNAPDYPEVAKAAIECMYEQVGRTEYSEDGLMKKGVLIRHLLLPGGVLNAVGVMKWVKNRFDNKVAFSLMGQYTPPDGAKLPPPLNRKITAAEYAKAEEYLMQIGITEGYVQDSASVSADYLPSFDLTGV